MTGILTVRRGTLHHPAAVGGGAFLSGSFVGDRNLPNKKKVTDTGGTYRLMQTARVGVSALELTFTNWEFDTDGTGDVNGSNAYTIGKCYLEHGGTLSQVLFPGAATSVSVPVGGTVKGTVTKAIAAGDTYYIRTYVTPDVGGGSYTCLSPGAIDYPGELSLKGGDAANQTGTTALTDYGDIFAPNAITGTVTSGTVRSVAVLGDSIVAGIGDTFSTPNAVGYLYRALYGQRAFYLAALSGESAQRYLLNGSKRKDFVGPAATYAICEYGINDLQGSRTLAQIKADLISIWTQIVTANSACKVFQTTITPKSSSTDAWVTTTNQTADATVHATRPALNAWIRAGAPMAGGVGVAPGTGGAIVAGSAGHPLWDYLEVSDLVESARDSGIWAAGKTDDGIHPNSSGHQAMVPGVDMTKLI